MEKLEKTAVDNLLGEIRWMVRTAKKEHWDFARIAAEVARIEVATSGIFDEGFAPKDTIDSWSTR